MLVANTRGDTVRGNMRNASDKGITDGTVPTFSPSTGGAQRFFLLLIIFGNLFHNLIQFLVSISTIKNLYRCEV